MLMRWKLLLSWILVLMVTFLIFFPSLPTHARGVYEEKTIVRLWVAESYPHGTTKRPDIRSKAKAMLEENGFSVVPGEYPQYDAELGINVGGKPLCEKYCTDGTSSCFVPTKSCEGASLRGTIQLSVGVKQQYEKTFRGVISSPHTVKMHAYKGMAMGTDESLAPFKKAFQASNFKSALLEIIKKLPSRPHKEE